MGVRSGCRCHGELRCRLSSVPSLSKHVKAVGSVVVVGVEGTGCGFSFDFGNDRDRGHVLGLGCDGLGLWCRWLDSRQAVDLFTLCGSAQGRSMEVDGAGSGAAAGQLCEKGRVGTWSREHRPAPARCQSGAQRRLVWRREAATEVMRVAEVVGRA